MDVLVSTYFVLCIYCEHSVFKKIYCSNHILFQQIILLSEKTYSRRRPVIAKERQ